MEENYLKAAQEILRQARTGAVCIPGLVRSAMQEVKADV